MKLNEPGRQKIKAALLAASQACRTTSDLHKNITNKQTNNNIKKHEVECTWKAELRKAVF